MNLPLYYELLIRSLPINNFLVFHFKLILFIHSLCSLSINFLDTSVVFGVDPLILVSLFQVLGHFIGGLDERLVTRFVSRVVVQVLLRDVQGVELLNGIVVVSDLWESE